ncbi:MAG: poly-gamma-glutamate synthase PgsB [Candidatus Parabeggiatoa sp.]|nr:poly-gamma-glutamate synthase PgsB [Candidatus Parabeggiatoa sp.]
MNVFAIVTVSTIVFLLYLLLESLVHIKKLKSIPVRIHVNGTRGKSSVTRLISAALREAGFKVVAKTTGTLPRVITDQGVELPVYRLEHHPNIIEQLRVISFAARNKANVLVIECMALNPAIQSVTELNMIKSTHGIIINTRADHLDVMGPTERDVTLALLGTTPKNAKLFTCERNYMPEFQMACQDRNSELVVVSEQEADNISDEEMRHFSYMEHKENVALAMTVCQSLNVPKETALKGMYQVVPDVGATHEYHVDFYGVKQVVFINGFAANDPKTSQSLWESAIERHKEKQRKIMVINTRADRLPRSKQIAESLALWKPADKYIVIGSQCFFLIKTAIKQGLSPTLFLNAEGAELETIFEIIMDESGSSSVVVGIGNIKDEGLELLRFFRNRAKLTK